MAKYMTKRSVMVVVITRYHSLTLMMSDIGIVRQTSDVYQEISGALSL
jgi:hypothetical protein